VFPRDMVCLRNISVDTLHKGGTEDNNNNNNISDTNLGIREIHTDFWLGNLKERDHLKDLGVDVRIILNRAFQNYGSMWT
jgi:hypothetical protein